MTPALRWQLTNIRPFSGVNFTALSNRLFHTWESICSFQVNFTSSSSISRSMFFSVHLDSSRSMQVRSCSSSWNSLLAATMSLVSRLVSSRVLAESSDRYSVSSRIIRENSFCCSGVRSPL